MPEYIEAIKNINKFIDQTILKPEATEEEILTFIAGVKKYKFYAACVNPCWVVLVRKNLPLEIKVCSVVGFPLGASNIKIKVLEARNLIEKGCDEIDMVMNIGKLKGGDYRYVGKEIKEVVGGAQGRVVKVIIETCLLNNEEKVAAANIIKECGASFVKTSTGFLKEGAKIEDVKLLRKIVGPEFGVKASGGIRDYHAATAFIEAGANRIGTSSGEVMMEEFESRLKEGDRL